MPERDLNRLLETFADLTERVPRRPLMPRREWLVRRLIAFALTSVVIVAVGGLAFAYTSGLVPASTGSPRPSNGIQLLTHRMTDRDALGTHTTIAGAPIVLEQGCLYVSGGARRWLAIWPTGTTIDESMDPAVIRNPAGESLTPVGELFSLSGWSVDGEELDEAPSYLDRPIPDVCAVSQLLLIDPSVEALEATVGTWRVDEARPPVSSSTTLEVLVTQEGGGCDPRGQALPPEIDYGAEQIVITLSFLDVGGRCRGGYYPITIGLSEPIGHRQLVDGYDDRVRWPSEPIALTPSPAVDVSPQPPADLVGRLIGTDLAGPCSFVAAEGELWTIVWPDGYTVRDHQRPVLTGPDNRVVAVDGDVVGLEGTQEDGSSPTCMTGRIFRAIAVVFVERTQDEPLPIHAARITALRDPLLVDYIISHAYHEVETATYGYPGEGGAWVPAILVKLTFTTFADDLPIGGCDIVRDVDRPVGVVWLVDAAGSDILARSPIWDDGVRCF